MFPGGDEDRYSRGGLSEGRLSSACGTDEPSQWRYHHDLAAVGFEVIAMSFDYGVYSALGVTQLPAPDQRSAFAEQIRRAVAPHDISASTFTSRYWPGGSDSSRRCSASPCRCEGIARLTAWKAVPGRGVNLHVPQAFPGACSRPSAARGFLSAAAPPCASQADRRCGEHDEGEAA